MARGQSATSLAPGFRFHPTDEELVRFYLKRKVMNKPFRLDPISVVDVYKCEPWDLPGKSKLKTRDLEWYFFCMLDKKYSNGSKTNRATEKGYWKTTGKDRPIRWNSRVVGMKKTLVYHQGRAPRGQRSNWVMHEYRLVDEELEKSGVAQDAFVLCRIFQKSGTGPKNGEQYGAPFIEEEWDDNENLALLPGDELLVANDLSWPDEEYVETSDLFQNLDHHASLENSISPFNGCNDDSGNSGDVRGDASDADIKPYNDKGLIHYDISFPNPPGFSGEELTDSQNIYESFAAGRNKILDRAASFEPFYDAYENPYGEGFYANDNGTVDPEMLDDQLGFDMVDEYINFLDAEDKNLAFDVSELVGDNSTIDPVLKDVKEETEEGSRTTQEPSTVLGQDEASCSKKAEPIEYEPDTKPSFFKKASQMLDAIPAHPAYASEFPMKDSALRLQPGQSSTSIHVTAGLIRIETLSSVDDHVEWPFGKTRSTVSTYYYSYLVNGHSLTEASLLSNKSGSLTSLSWIFLIIFWILVYSVSYRIRSDVTAK